MAFALLVMVDGSFRSMPSTAPSLAHRCRVGAVHHINSMGVGRETTAPLLRARLDLSAYLIWIDIRISSASTMLDISAASLRRVAWWN